MVEIDESKFGERKYHRGRRFEGQWVFGRVERESGHCFMVPVETRDRAALLTPRQSNNAGFLESMTAWAKKVIESSWNAAKRTIGAS